MLREAIAQIANGEDLTESQARQAMEIIMTGQATPSQIGAFITGLRIKGETVDEITGCAQAMRASSQRIHPQVQTLIDTCGTGGDGANTFNISTAATFVVAGAGLSVAKHGNRSVSSKCGSADVLEALGVEINLTPQQVESCIEKVGIGFMFAPHFHASMKHAAAPRREIGIRTIFNLLGPLTNPASAQVQLVGVYDPSLTEPVAEVLGRLGVQQAYVVHGLDPLDEISISAATKISHLNQGRVETFTFHPQDVGLSSAVAESIQGGNAADNAEIIQAILLGEPGPRRDVVVVNAAAGLVVGGYAGTLTEGVKLAEEIIDTRRAYDKLEALIQFTQGAAA